MKFDGFGDWFDERAPGDGRGLGFFLAEFLGVFVVDGNGEIGTTKITHLAADAFFGVQNLHFAFLETQRMGGAELDADATALAVLNDDGDLVFFFFLFDA
jgi:hypothetical protein